MDERRGREGRTEGSHPSEWEKQRSDVRGAPPGNPTSKGGRGPGGAVAVARFNQFGGGGGGGGAAYRCIQTVRTSRSFYKHKFIS